MMRTVEIFGVKALVASKFFQRAKGLIGRSSLPRGEGLLIERCNAIHTFFMKFPIDAVFLDRHGRVVRIVRAIRPWRLIVWGGWRAKKVLEVAARPDAKISSAPC
jgi:uncharacterized membrane protein (UPF0127 family)